MLHPRIEFVIFPFDFDPCGFNYGLFLSWGICTYFVSFLLMVKTSRPLLQPLEGPLIKAIPLVSL